MNSDEAKSRQQQSWDAEALAWERWDSWFQSQTKELSNWLCDQAGLRPGMAVLDLACGTGRPALTAAARVLPDGHVVASDIATGMIAAAERVGRSLGLHNVEYREIDMEKIPYPDDSFDAVTCRFGLMFCPDPVKAASEIRRVLKPGAQFALSVWDGPEKNEQFSSLQGPVSRILKPTMNPNAPGPFALAAPGKLEGVLTAAGFADFRVVTQPSLWEYESAEKFWEIMSDLSAPVRAARNSAPPETVLHLRETVIEGLRSRFGQGVVHLQTTPICATGQK